MNINARIDYLNTTIAAIEHTWPQVSIELKSRIEDLTQKLIGEDNEQTRGAIKELRRLLVLPETLASERDYIKAAQDE